MGVIMKKKTNHQMH